MYRQFEPASRSGALQLTNTSFGTGYRIVTTFRFYSDIQESYQESC